MALGQNGRSNEFLFPLHHFLSSERKRYVCLCVCVCVYVYVYTYYVYARAHTHTYYNHFLSTLHPPQKCPALCTRISIPEPYALRPTPYALNLTPKYSSKPSSDASLYCNVVF